MNNLNIKNIKFLAECGLLMPYDSFANSPTISHPCLHPDKPHRKYCYPNGYPVRDYYRDNSYPQLFPSIEYKDKDRDIDYVIPYGLNRLLINESRDFLNCHTEFKEKLKQWGELAKKYLNEDIDEHITSSIEIELLLLYHQAYALYITNKFDSLNILSSKFLRLYENNGRTFINEHLNDIYVPIISMKSICEYIYNNVFDSHNDFIMFEQEIIINHQVQKGFSNVCGMNPKAIQLWYDLMNSKYEGKYKEDSPILQEFRKFLYNSSSGADIVAILSWLEGYDISIIKKDLLYFFYNSQYKEVIEYVEERLQHYDILPTSSQVFLDQEINMVYKSKIVLDINYIRQKINNNLLGTTTLIAILTKAFKEDEKNYSTINYEIFFNEGIMNFYIESLDEKIVKQLSNKFYLYLNALIDPNFLQQEIIVKLTDHGNEIKRKQHEDDTVIMEHYKKTKNNFLLNAQLHNDLPQPKVKLKSNKI